MAALESFRELFVLYILRAPVTQCMLLAKNPSAAPVAAVAALFIAIAWLDLRRAGNPTRERVLYAAGLAAGVVGYLWFFRAGKFAWDVTVDGSDNWLYFAGLRQAALRNEAPYYLLYAGNRGTERYFANPEALLAPHALLMKAVGIPVFSMIHVVLVLSAGYCGLIALKRELNLLPFTWSVFVVLFFFSGHITANLSVIRMQWLGYFLLPGAFLYFVRLARGDASLKNSAVLGSTLAAIILLGSWHIFMWTLIFFLFMCTSVSRCVFAGRTLMIAALLASVRLLPAVLTFGLASNNYIGGFRHFAVFMQALVGDLPLFADGIEWYEYDAYVGYVGFGLLCAGLMPQRERAARHLNALLLPSAALLVLAFGDVYKWTFFRLPGFVSERYTSRFAIVPVLILVLLGCVRADSWIRRYGRRRIASSAALLLASWFLVVQLVLKAYYIRPESTGRGIPLPVDVLKQLAVEPVYLRAVWVGVMLSTITLLWVAWQVRTPSAASEGQ